MLKKVLIKGFKSYLSLVDMEEFSPGYNIICGRNGSGKSNFFGALQFVLSDEYGSLNPDQRQMLLHEGSGKEVFTAFVEIVFDNSDGRFPVDSKEVTIRRTVGAKKDEYFLDKKHSTKQDIVSFLESAGFSRSNPYYIVQQGKIQELATMSEEARLNLLKEVAGTRVYEERRAESVKIMEETAAKKSQVESMLQDLVQRLDSLEEERVELLEFQKLDTTRRSLQYALYEKERERAAAKLHGAEQRRSDLALAVDQADDAGGTSSEARNAEKAAKALQQQAASLSAARDQAREARAPLLQRAAQLRLENEDAQARLASETAALEAGGNALRDVRGRVDEARAALERAEERCRAARTAEDEINDALRVASTRLNELVQREARAAQFAGRRERDAWLREQAGTVETLRAQQQKQRDLVEAEVAAATQKAQELASALATAQKDFDKRKKALQTAADAIVKARSQRDVAADRRKELWRKEEDLRVNKSTRDRDLARAEKSMQGSVSRDVAAGLDAVRKIVEESNVQGVHGPVIELFKVTNEALQTAVDVTAGNALFHVVVDNDEVASAILAKMNAAKAPGRVTFLPLSRLTAKVPALPNGPGIFNILNDAIDFDEAVRPAMVHVFGRTVICASLEQATTVGATHHLDCVTLDGDRVDRKGAITGGFVDRKASRLRLQDEVGRLRSAAKHDELELNKVAAALRDEEAAVAQHVTAMRKAEEQKERERSAVESLAQQIQSLVRAEQTAQANLRETQSRQQTAAAALADLASRHDSLVREMASPFKNQLSEEEREELNATSAKVQQLRLAIVEKSGARITLEAEISSLRELISGNLSKRHAELSTDHRLAFDVQQVRAEAEEKRKALSEVEEELAECEARLAELDKELDKVNAQMGPAQKAFEKLIEQGGHIQSAALQARKQLEELLHERAMYLRELDAAKRKIREVGTINHEEFLKFKDKDANDLYNRLHAVQEKLQGYTHVNKKAGEQFVSFVQQRDDLTSRNQELDESAEAINNLIKVLDSRKDEAILRTFKGVAMHFANVWKELVPDGEASLTMVKTAAAAGAAPAGKRARKAEEADEAAAAILSFSGVKIRASFGGAMGAPQDLALLSGGQKSLVALALIFAIQRADPAPFYLMDEVDAALDSTHRLAVANLLKKSADGENGLARSQYIVATFKPELVAPADKHFKIFFANKVSTIRAVTQQEAIATINAANQPAAVARAEQ